MIKAFKPQKYFGGQDDRTNTIKSVEECTNKSHSVENTDTLVPSNFKACVHVTAIFDGMSFLVTINETAKAIIQ